MKKILILALIYISTLVSAFAENIYDSKFIYEPLDKILSYKVYKTIDFSEGTQRARDVFYDFYLKDNNYKKEEFERIFGSSAFFYVQAYEVDLNDDGVNEIIGHHGTGCGNKLCAGFVIQKKQNKWEAIGYVDFVPGSKIYVLTEKNYGYRSIKSNVLDMNHIPWCNAPKLPYILKYKNNIYSQVITSNKKIADK